MKSKLAWLSMSLSVTSGILVTMLTSNPVFAGDSQLVVAKEATAPNDSLKLATNNLLVAEQNHDFFNRGGMDVGMDVLPYCQKAIQYYDIVLKDKPDNSEAHFGKARANQLLIWRAGNRFFGRDGKGPDTNSLYKAALDGLSKAISIDPKMFNALMCRADLVVDKDPKLAIDDCTNALSISKDYQIYSVRGKANANLERIPEAIKDLTTAIDMLPNQGDRAPTDKKALLELRGSLYEKSGNKELAKQDQDAVTNFLPSDLFR